MNTFTLGACFQHELHTGPYFMTFAPRLYALLTNDIIVLLRCRSRSRRRFLNFLLGSLSNEQWRRQRERQKFAYLVGKNNSFARPARAFFTFVHFVDVVSETTTLNSQVFGFMKNVST